MIRILVVLVFLFSVLGCSQANMLEKFSSSEDQAIAKNYIDLLVSQSFNDIEAAADQSIDKKKLHSALSEMAALIPAGTPISVKVVGAHIKEIDDVKIINTTFEYEFPGKWLLINVAIKYENNLSAIVGFNVMPQTASLEEQSRFELLGKTAGQYFVLLAAAVASLFTLYALILCVRTKMSGRKWPWILFIIFGVGQVAVNWSTAQLNFSPLSIQLFSAGAFAPLYGAWVISASFPLGAVIFFIKRKNLLDQSVGS